MIHTTAMKRTTHTTHMIRTIHAARTIAILLMLCLASATATAVQLKIATLAPDGSTWLKEARKGATEIADKTAGRVKIQFYPGGSMGNEETVIRKMRIGQLHGSAMTSGTLATVYPDIQIYSLPLLFDSYEEVDHVRKLMDQKLIDNLGAKGYMSYGFIEGGFAFLMSGKETRGIADLKGRKAWLREGDSIGQAVVEAAGLAPIPLSLTDVLTGLQTGLIDTVAGPPVAAVALQWFTKVKYLTDLPLIYTYGTLIIDQRALKRISAEDQEIVAAALRGVCERLDKAGRAENEEALEALTRQGMKIVEAPPASMEEWRSLAAKATASLVTDGEISTAIHKEAKAHLSKLRSQSTE